MTEPRPVSAHLEADLREQARQHGILVWLDKEGTYTDFADELGRRADARASCSRCGGSAAATSSCCSGSRISPATSSGRSSRVSRG